MAVTKNLTKAIPYEDANGKVVIWDLYYTYENDSEGDATYYKVVFNKSVNQAYTDENGEIVEEYLHGMPARIFQHENEHMNGYIFTDLVSKLKLERGKKAQAKLVKQTIRRQQQRLSNEVKATAIKV